VDRQPKTHKHFMPDQMHFLAHHLPGMHHKDVAQLVSEDAVVQQYLNGVAVSPERVVTFDDGDRAFSLVFVDLPRTHRPGWMVQTVDDMDSQMQSRHPHRAVERSSLAGSSLRVMRATPNWLSSSAPENTGSGGPGARPVACGCAVTKAVRRPWQFALPQELRLLEDDYGANTDVALLDTVPTQEMLRRARRRWPDHELLPSLLHPDRLQIIRATGGLPNLGLSDHPYSLADHGLFAAGIVHALAPQARLHLIEVLNEHGVGSLESIVRGLRAATAIQTAHPLVVNCSFVLNVPQSELLAHQGSHDPELDGVTDVQVANWGTALEEIWELLHDHHVHVVAAAGNDATDGVVPPARFPAAFKRVMGVAALDPGEPYQPASYSNKADRPVGLGIATFGGRASNGLSDQDGGMLGVYIGDFPDGAENEHGWARWAGTSFATPVISGVLSVLIGAGRADPVDDLRRVLVGPQSETAIGEVFPVYQGAA